MNKKELVEVIANTMNLNKATAERILAGALDAITETLGKGDTVSLVGFGSFSIARREARQGKNPQSGETIQIPARNAVRFKGGKPLSETLNC
ncbi:MAG: HU family DNA-binding protein [Desulfocapsaceae bacterium]|nr:HU family DNA-binding protein [Desulfocapsaceae bacterium]